MRFETTPRFLADFGSLPIEHQRQFRAVVPAFHDACEDFVESGGQAPWPARLRVRRMTQAPGIWEMTWSFASPDGRATFAFVQREGDVRVLWRRIADHGVYQRP